MLLLSFGGEAVFVRRIARLKWKLSLGNQTGGTPEGFRLFVCHGGMLEIGSACSPVREENFPKRLILFGYYGEESPWDSAPSCLTIDGAEN